MLRHPGHSFRRQAAGAWGPDLAKKLSQLVKMEKNVMRSMELVGRERMEVAVCFFSFPISWGCVGTDGRCSNNSPFGVRPATTMSRTSRISSVSSFTKSASSRTSSSTATISTALP